MENTIKLKKRELTEDERKRVRKDLTIRGWSSIVSAAMIVSFAIVLTIHGIPLFAERGLTMPCIGAIWVAVIAIDFGIVRNGLQFLTWRNAAHLGIEITRQNQPTGLTDQILNLIGAVIFFVFGVVILFIGLGKLGNPNYLAQIPLSILSISLGISSAESAFINLWFRKRRLVDVVHNMEGLDI